MTEVVIGRNQSIDLESKSIDWFLYDNGIRHERVKVFITHRFLNVRSKETLLFSCYQIIIIIIVNRTTYIELTHIEPIFRFGTP